MAFALATVLVLPLSASADNRYVDDGGANTPGCTVLSEPCKEIKYAVEQAASGDTILIDEGTYVEAVSTAKVLTFVGASPGTTSETAGATIVRGPDGAAAPGAPAFDLPNGGTLIALRAEGGDGAAAFKGGDAVVFSSAGPAQLRADGCIFIGGDGGGLVAAGSGLRMEGTAGELTLTSEDTAFISGVGIASEGGATIDGPAAHAELIDPQLGGFVSPVRDLGLAVLGGASASIEDGFAIARVGVAVEEGTLSLNRVVILVERQGVLAIATVAGTTAAATVRNSVVLAFEEEGAVARTINGGGAASLTAVGSTFLSGGSAAVAVDGAPTGEAVGATLRNSIARNEPEEGVPPRDLLADGGSIDAAHSSFTSVLEVNGGEATDAAAADNVSGDPGLSETGGLGEIAGDSPLIDRGDPGILEPDEVDLEGEPRSLDGDGDCIPIPDIGAYEVTGQDAACPEIPSLPEAEGDPAPVVESFAMTNRAFAPTGAGKKKPAGASATRRGTRFSYRVSEPAAVRIAIERRRPGRKVRRGGAVRCVKPRPKRRKPRCARFTTVTTLTALSEGDLGSTPFSGRVGGRALKPGRYRASITATDTAGQRSEPRRLSFRVVRP